MEVLTIVLSGLLSLLASGGIVLDSLASKAISDRAIEIDRQKVRIDNAPSYQALGGKIQKVRVATRGIELQPNLRIAALELETEPINLDRSRLDLASLTGLRRSLKEPLQGAVRLVLTEADLNRTLQSPDVRERLEKILNRLVVRKAGSTNIAYELSDLSIELDTANTIGLKFKLNRAGSSRIRDAELALALKLKIEVINGKQISLVDPQGTVNERPMSSRLLQGFAEGISDRLNLESLESEGIIARLLQFEIDGDKIELATFVRMETKLSDLPSSKPETK